MRAIQLEKKKAINLIYYMLYIVRKIWMSRGSTSAQLQLTINIKPYILGRNCPFLSPNIPEYPPKIPTVRRGTRAAFGGFTTVGVCAVSVYIYSYVASSMQYVPIARPCDRGLVVCAVHSTPPSPSRAGGWAEVVYAVRHNNNI
jgi:hypothetical protein